MKWLQSIRFKHAVIFSAVFSFGVIGTTVGWTQTLRKTLPIAADSIIAASVPSNATPRPNDAVQVSIDVDMSGVQPPDHRLSGYQATLMWNPAVVQYVSFSTADPWTGTTVNPANTAAGKVEWNGFRAGGTDGPKNNIINFTFKVVGAAGSSTLLDVEFSDMTASTLKKVVGLVKTRDGKITVLGGPPKLADIANQTMDEAAALDVGVMATDPDGDPITLAARNLPGFATFIDNGGGNGLVRFAPGFNDEGVYANLQIIAKDNGGLADTTAFTLTVKNVNRPPQLTNIPNQTMDEAATLDVGVTATDPDGDGLQLTGKNLPPFATLVDNGNGNGLIRFAPGFNDAGVFANLQIIATDNGSPALADTTAFTLTVRNVNRPPAINAIADVVLDEGAEKCFSVSVSDPDGDNVSLSEQPPGVSVPYTVRFTDNGNGNFTVCVKANVGRTGDFPITLVAADNGTPSLSSSRGFKLTIRPIPPLACKLNIVSPKDGSKICEDTFTVKGITSISGGIPPYTRVCDINGIPVTVADSTFSLPVRCDPGVTITLIARCKVTDAANSSVVCSDTIRVTCPKSPVCAVDIISPSAGAVICADSIKVKATTKIVDGVPPYNLTCTINGMPSIVSGNTFAATVPLTLGLNTLIAACTVTDSCGRRTTCSDTVRVQSIRDKTPPECTFTFRGISTVKGFLSDNESGIAKVEPLYLYNANLIVDPFTPGDKQVNFRLEGLGQDSYLGFDIKITDVCGNTHVCDPIMTILTLDRETRDYTFRFRPIDRYLVLNNHGLSSIRIELNGNKFELNTAAPRGARTLNAYRMPKDGEISLDLQPYLRDGENIMRVEIDGPAGATADFLLIDERHHLDHKLELQPIPSEFQLSQNYPNPFNPSTTIRFGIPAHLTDGAAVQLRIYNMKGELVRTLMDQTMLPGQYAIEWNGRNKLGEPVASGIYIYQIIASDFRAAKRLLFIK